MMQNGAYGLKQKFVQRSLTVDVLRGFALLGIIWVNAPFFAYNPTQTLPLESSADYVAMWFTFTFASGKFFVLFSFLFGFGISVMLSRSGEPKQRDVRGRYFRRAIGLWVIGLLHAVFLFFGDILILYGVLSLVIWLFRNRSDRFILILAGLAFLLGVMTQTLVMLPQLWDMVEADAAAQKIGTGFAGSYRESLPDRLMMLPVAAVIVVFFNGAVACACFLFGYRVSRKRLFPLSPGELDDLARPAKNSLGIGLLFSGLASAVYLASDYENIFAYLVASVVISLSAPLISFGLAIGVMRWAEQAGGNRLKAVFAKVGKMSLTGYILHSILLGFVFHGWGLGYFEKVGQAGVILIAFGVFAAIALILNVWSRWFRYGPDEWLLRCFIDWKIKPLRN